VQQKTLRHLSKYLSSWDAAISDANQLIAGKKAEIRQLKTAIRRIERLKQRGVPYPGKLEPGTVEASVGESKTEARRLRQE
jgi:multidrug resistance efflux pump